MMKKIFGMLNLKIDDSIDYNDLKILVHFEKYEDDDSNDIGQITIIGDITNKIPTIIWIDIYGKGDSGPSNGGSEALSGDILNTAISLSNSYLTLDLGKIFKEPNEFDINVKQNARYKLIVTSNKLSIIDAKKVTLENNSYGYTSNGNDGIEGYIEIQ